MQSARPNSRPQSRFLQRLLGGLGVMAALFLGGIGLPAAQPQQADVLPLHALQPGMRGEVWTVFAGTEPEPFEVEVTGVIANALGPGKSMILCQLTDPKVQHMGAVAGMSGSPLYIDGRFVGALSYQVQRFETVRFAGFTPAEDLLEVRQIALNGGPGGAKSPDTLPAANPGGETPLAAGQTPASERTGIEPLSPMFSFGGLSPHVAGLMAAPLSALGINTTGLGGANGAGFSSGTSIEGPVALGPGDAVGAALAIGDITLAGTGTVSQVDGDRVLAFGHPLLGLGDVEVPMTEAEIVTILPSNLSSFKISNTGRVIGTVRQDRLSAIYGELGVPPDMIDIEVQTPQRTLSFAAVRHPRLTPVITAAGLSQAVLGSNDAGMAEGFAVATEVTFPDGATLEMSRLYAGPESFKAGLQGLVQNFSTWMQNPVEEVFPAKVRFRVDPLTENPTASLDNVRFSHRIASPGQPLLVSLNLRDFQSSPWRESVDIPVDNDWVGRPLEVVVAAGPVLDNMTGSQKRFPVSQIRDFSAYLDALRAKRRPDGLYVAVVTGAELFLDQTDSTLNLPDSLARIARSADEARYQERATREVLWETHILPDRLIPGGVKRRLVVKE